jgi:carbon-monoxide dehydrogenase medium subunit
VKSIGYFAPNTLEEALQLLAEYGPKMRVLAGGTDLVRDMNLEFNSPEAILWIGKLGLEYIVEQGEWIQIGTATRMKTAGSSALLKEKASALAHAAGKLASPPVRSLATLGGNLCNASPGADAGCALLGLGAEVILTSINGQRIVPLDKFYLGPKRTVIQPQELLTEIRVKPVTSGEACAYAKIGRRQAMTLAVVNATSRIRLDGSGSVSAVKICVGAAAPTLMRIRLAEAMLMGQVLTTEAIQAAAEIASQEIKPIDDVHGTAWYRRKIAKVLVERTLREAGNLDGGSNHHG